MDFKKIIFFENKTLIGSFIYIKFFNKEEDL